MSQSTRVVFTQGGKGGVAKTEVVLSLIAWYQEQGLSPALLDFDIENSNKSGLQNFYPKARKLDVHKEGTLDAFFDVCDSAEGIVVAGLGAGAGEATYQWFNDAFEDAEESGIRFTSVGVTIDDGGAVQSVLKWGKKLQGRVEYLIVLNEMGQRGCEFGYWKAEEATGRFEKAFAPHIMVMQARIQAFQAELRNQCLTLQRVIDADHDCKTFRYMKNIFRAKRAQRELFAGFDEAADILTPSLVEA